MGSFRSSQNLVFVLSSLIGVLGAVSQFFFDLVTGKWSKLGQDLQAILFWIKLLFINVWGSILDLVGGLIDGLLVMVGSSGDKLKAAIGGWFSGLGTTIHDALVGELARIGGNAGAIGSAIGSLFSGLGSAFHNAGIFIAQALLDGFRFLMLHNTYFRDIVYGIVAFASLLRQSLQLIIANIVADVTQQWNLLMSLTRGAWALIQQYILMPIQLSLGVLRSIWSTMASDAGKGWAMIVTWMGNGLGDMGTWLHAHLIDPITNMFNWLIAQAEGWGHNVITMVIKGMKAGLADLGAGAAAAAGAIAKFLGFSSPAKEGPGATADQWMPNLMGMLARTLAASTPQLQRAAYGAAGALSPLSGAAPGTSGAGGFAAFAGAGAGGGGNTTYNLNFPGVSSADEIKKAVREVQQEDYRKTRQVGYGRGLRAGN